MLAALVRLLPISHLLAVATWPAKGEKFKRRDREMRSNGGRQTTTKNPNQDEGRTCVPWADHFLHLLITATPWLPKGAHTRPRHTQKRGK